MQIIKQGRSESTRGALRFFKENFNKTDKVKYIVLYFAEWEWQLNPELYHQYAIVVGEKAQLWMSSLTWGYTGAGPYALFELMQIIDPSITYEEIQNLEWPGSEPIMFESVEGKLVLQSLNEDVKSLISIENDRLPWELI